MFLDGRQRKILEKVNRHTRLSNPGLLYDRGKETSSVMPCDLIFLSAKRGKQKERQPVRGVRQHALASAEKKNHETSPQYIMTGIKVRLLFILDLESSG